MCSPPPSLPAYTHRYLCSHGVASDRVQVDPEAYSTLDNAVNSKAMLGAPPAELVVLTHDWHMQRSQMLFEVCESVMRASLMCV